jgi:cation/acetate symporter
MAFTSSTRLVNPRLGTYFGIFTAALAALVLMALMLEQLGLSDTLLRWLLFAAPLLLYATIGLNAGAKEAHDFFASGRRVPAFFNGLVLGVSALGGTAFLGLTGALFIAGFDALCLSIGWCAGLVFMAVLFAPYIRKFGTYTIPAFLGRRFDSRSVRVLAAVVLCPPILLVLIAETRFAAYASAWLLGQPETLLTAILVVLVAAVLAAGGMRSLTWSSVAKAITALLALAIPATIFGLMASNLPLPQMTHGNTLRVLTRLEMMRNVPIVIASPLSLDLAGAGIEPLAKRFVQSFGSVGNFGFVLASLVMAAGIAASPALLPRAGTTPGVYEARKSLGWAVLVVGIVLLTLPAVAVYVRFLLFEQVIGQSAEQLPAWFQVLQQAGIAQIEPSAQPVSLGRLGFERDAVLFALPIAAGFPQVLVYLALIGALAAALAALASSMFALAASVAEDLMPATAAEAAPDRARLGRARIALAAVGAIVIWLGMLATADPLQLFLWAMTLSASSCFPVLVLSIWWRRTRAWGAMVGMLVGFVVAAGTILLAETGAVALPSALAGAIGLPCAMLVTVACSLVAPATGRNVLEQLREMRVPGGETVYDREMRLLRLKNRNPS